MDKVNKQQVLRENINEMYDLRKQGLNYIQIADKMSTKFNTDIESSDISAVFKKEEIKAFAYGSDDRRKNADYELQQLQGRYKKASEMVDWLTDSITKIKDSLSDLPPEEYAIKFIKLTPVILATSKEILNQLEYVNKQQEKMSIEQKNMILSPIEVNIQMTKKLKEWAERGYIKILKVIPEGKEEEDEKKSKEKYESEEAEEVPASV